MLPTRRCRGQRRPSTAYTPEEWDWPRKQPEDRTSSHRQQHRTRRNAHRRPAHRALSGRPGPDDPDRRDHGPRGSSRHTSPCWSGSASGQRGCGGRLRRGPCTRRPGRRAGRRRRTGRRPAALARRAVHGEGVDRGRQDAEQCRCRCPAQPRRRTAGGPPDDRRRRDPARADQHLRAVHVDRDREPGVRADHGFAELVRTAGSSSGGEGATVGSGGAPFGLGSDVGGSIRMPAFCCGVFGHKPSVGLVPLTGAFPAPRGGAARLLANGRWPAAQRT